MATNGRSAPVNAGLRLLGTAFAVFAAGLPAPLCAQRSGAAPAWSLQEDVRIGGQSDGPANLLDIRGIGLTRQGNIFVLEFKDQELRVFSASGTFLRRAARRGAGPGEIANANGIAIGTDDVVWVNDPSNGRFSLFRADGTFLKQVVTPIRGFAYIWHGRVVGPDRIIDDLPVNVPTGRTDPVTGRPAFESRLRFVSADGKADTLDFPRCKSQPIAAASTLVFNHAGQRGQSYVSLPFQPWQQLAFTDLRTVWCTPSDEYRVLTGPVGGTLSEVVHRQFPPVTVTDEEHRREAARIDSFRTMYGPPASGDPSAIPRTKPAIARIFADDQGQVWVRRNGVPAAKPVFEVYDASGRQVATVTSSGPVGDQTFIAHDALLTVVNDADDVPFVVRYRIVRR